MCISNDDGEAVNQKDESNPKKGIDVGQPLAAASTVTICPGCKGIKLTRYGKTTAGHQKFRCLVPGCRRQFVAGSDHLVDPTEKATVEGLLKEGVSPGKIARAMSGISRRWIYKLARRMKQCRKA